MPDMQALRQNRLSAFAVRSAPSIPTTTGLAATIAVLRTSPTGCVLAMDGNILRGIFTERDYLQRVVLHDLPPTTTLGDIMTPDPLTLDQDQPVGRAIELMVTRKLRHLPVTSRGIIRGVISGKDIIEFIAQQYPAEVMNLPPDLQQVSDSADGG